MVLRTKTPQTLLKPRVFIVFISCEHKRYSLLNNKAVNQGSHLNLSETSAQRHRRYFLFEHLSTMVRLRLRSEERAQPLVGWV